MFVGVGYTDLDLPYHRRFWKWSRNIRIKTIQMWKSFCEFDNEIVLALNDVGKIPAFETTDQ